MSTRRAAKALGRWWGRSLVAAAREAARAGSTALRTRTPVPAKAALASGGDWLPGVAIGLQGARRFRLYRPPGVEPGERRPLLVMLHGCGQDAAGFAASTRMNRVAARERFFVLYPEQDRLAHAQGCWHWFDTRSGRAQAEAALILKALDQVSLLYPIDRAAVAIAGLSAGASMAALLATRHPERFCAVAMHSGVAPGLANSGLSALGAMRGRGVASAAAPAAAGPAWPPLLVIHGRRDAVVSPDNALQAARAWAAAAGARPLAPRELRRGQRHPFSVTDFARGRSLVARLVEIPALAHAWSGGAARHAHSDSAGPDASRMVWAFVALQLKRRGRALPAGPAT